MTARSTTGYGTYPGDPMAPPKTAHRPLPYWTAADQAEQDIRLHRMVDFLHDHAHECRWCDNASNCICTNHGKPTTHTCDPCQEQIQGFLDWREERLLQSRAVWYRRVQDAADDDDHGERLYARGAIGPREWLEWTRPAFLLRLELLQHIGA